MILNSSLQNYDAASVGLVHAISADGNVTLAAEMPSAREAVAAVTVEDKICVLGGEVSVSGGDSMPSSVSTVEIYDPASNSWAAGPKMPRRSRGSAVYLNKPLVFFGNGPLDPREPMILDPATGTWSKGCEGASCPRTGAEMVAVQRPTSNTAALRMT